MRRHSPEMSRAQFRAALERNGFQQVLVWVQDMTGQADGVSWGMVMHANGKMAYRATLAKVLREREAEIKKRETA